MNVQIKYSKNTIKSDEKSDKIKKDIENYIFYFFTDYLDKNTNEKDLKELEEMSKKLDFNNISDELYYKELLKHLEEKEKNKTKKIEEKEIEKVIEKVLSENKINYVPYQ